MAEAFEMYKLRTVVTDAEQRRGELLHLTEMEGPVFKVANDPRRTRLGRLIRRYSVWAAAACRGGSQGSDGGREGDRPNSRRRRTPVRICVNVDSPGAGCSWEQFARPTLGVMQGAAST